MTKIRKQKRKKKFRANVNRKRLRNKLQKLPKIECEDIESSWELKRSIRTNLRDMGLAYDPNEALKIPSMRARIKITRKNIVENEDAEEEEAEGEKGSDPGSEKIHVAEKLEADAKAPRERMFRLPKGQVRFVTYLLDKYGDDYKAMARDRKNHYQMTWCQIRSKINTFKSIPEQYAEYLLKSGDIVLDDPEPLEETRRKIGAENVKKHCVAKKRKAVEERPKKPIWEVESEGEGVAHEEGEKTSHNDDGTKKLKLFSEDESSGDEEGKKSTKKKKRMDEDGKSDESLRKLKTKLELIRKSASSDSDDESLDGDNDAEGFVNLSELSNEELSEDDVLDDGEFVSTDSE